MDTLNSGELRLAAAAGLLGGGWHLDGAAPHWAEGDLDPAAAVSLAGRGREYVAPVFTLRRLRRLGRPLVAGVASQWSGLVATIRCDVILVISSTSHQ